ncbi:MAG: hypothetical protein AB1488_00075 [Nitrospirota bacterium]
MDKYKNAINYVINLIKSLISTAEVEVTQPRPYQYCFCVDTKGQRFNFIFNRSTMDDFENSIVTEKGSDRYYATEGFIKFQVYTTLGQAGLISHFDISDEILNEKRDWLQRYSAKFEKPAWLYEVFYQGLKKLSDFLAGLIRQYKTVPEEIKKEQEEIAHLIKWYDEHHNFTDTGISETSLGYFKAAAVCVILDREKERKLIKIPRILKAKDQEIYSIVSQIRENPFPQIKMPDCIFDYAEHMKASTSGVTKSSTKELVFIACGQSTAREKALGIKVEGFLKKQNVNCFLAEKVNDLESLNSHIFKNLTECTGFIGILHKREESKYDTSVWINQEVAIAAYLRSIGRTIPALVLYEEGTAIEGLIKYTIANPLTFKSEEEALSKIEDWVRRQSFKYEERLPELDIILPEERKHFGASSGGGRKGYHDIGYALSFRVRNKSDINMCLEDAVLENELLGKGKLDKTNPRLSKLPFNIGPRKTEELNLLVKFPNEIDEDMKGKDIKLEGRFEFADRVITKELIGYIS